MTNQALLEEPELDLHEIVFLTFGVFECIFRMGTSFFSVDNFDIKKNISTKV